MARNQGKNQARGGDRAGGRGTGGPKGQASKSTRAPSRSKPTPAPAPDAVPAWFVPLGFGLLVVATGAALVLSLKTLGSMDLPGCGPGSGCAKAANSALGKVPGLGWPTSHAGVAYFAALLVAWAVQRGDFPGAVRWVVRGGGVLSVVFLLAMITGGYLCPYCLAVQVANILFVALVEGRRIPTPAPRLAHAVAAFGGAFLVATAVLGVFQARHQAAIREKDEAQLTDSTQRIIDEQAKPETPLVVAGPPFTGRYRVGPEVAPIRIVIISDYQCPDCKGIEADVRRLLEDRTDISFSAKQFPFCKDCNRVARKHNFSPHDNACWAARAAETAGLLYGNDGFWRMHHWLFDHSGSFTDAEIRAALPELGFEPNEFLRVMQTVEALQPVLEDIEEAAELGLRQTPMIFVNGVELIGWRTPNALPRMVEQVAATNPPARTAANDHPPKAFEKYLNNWQEQPRRTLPPDPGAWGLGDPAGAAQVVVWGDLREPYTSTLDTRIRAVTRSSPDVHYTFRHYPIDEKCNPSATRTIHPDACRAAQAAQAAGMLGGPDAYWAMHAWLMENQNAFSDAAIRQTAITQGLDPDALFEMMDSPVVAEAIRADAAAAKRLGLRGVPFAFINGKQVPFWNLEGEPLIEAMIETARGGE